MRSLAVVSVCASLILGVVACGGSGSSLQNPFRQPSPNPSPALPTPPPAPTPTPMLLPNGLVIGAVVSTDGNSATGGQGGVVDGIDCATPVLTYHIHSHVTLFHSGMQVALPKAIGVIGPIYNAAHNYVDDGSCFYHLHTHDDTGIVHIENAAQPPTPFTLGQVFDIWGEPLTNGNIAGFMGPTIVYVGTSLLSGDPRSIQLINPRADHARGWRPVRLPTLLHLDVLGRKRKEPQALSALRLHHAPSAVIADGRLGRTLFNGDFLGLDYLQ